jgi:hypothetical protein
MEVQDTAYGSFCVGATAVICLAAILYVNVFCKENLRIQKAGQTEYDSTILHVAESIPYLMQAVEYILDKFDGAAAASAAVTEPVLPISQPNPLKIHMKKFARFEASVASVTASPHYEDDFFFFADIPSETV